MSTEAKTRKTRENHSMEVRGDRDERPPLPIILFVKFKDHGPCEPGSPSAFCPHCGSGGRYVFTFICQDGSRRGAMRGCVKLFRTSKLAEEQMKAFDRVKDRVARKYKPASWDLEITGVTSLLEAGMIEVSEATARIEAALEERRRYLSRNGFKPNGQRR